MTLAFTTLGQGNITMLDSIDEIINTFDKSYPTGGGTKSSAAPDILLKVDEECKNLIPRICGVSSPGGKNIICYQADQDGKLHRNFILHFESDRT